MPPEGTRTMLRITTHHHPQFLKFQLEGGLAGPWAWVLEGCWLSTPAGRHGSAIRFDLTGLTFIDAAGKAYLAAIHRQGAEFVAADCLTKAVVAEIANAPNPDCGGPKQERESKM
jgi:hypothetical protein